jgi:hypothetical protein
LRDFIYLSDLPDMLPIAKRKDVLAGNGGEINRGEEEGVGEGYLQMDEDQRVGGETSNCVHFRKFLKLSQAQRQLFSFRSLPPILLPPLSLSSFERQYVDDCVMVDREEEDLYAISFALRPAPSGGE